MSSKKRLAFAAIVVLGLLADLWTKHAAFEALAKVPKYTSIVVIENFFHLYEMRNPGMAWSLLQNVKPRFWIAVRGVLCVVLLGVWWTRPRLPWWANAAFALVIAGALGNLYDNIFATGPKPEDAGRVRDFILLIFWGWKFPVFNIADSMITVGAPLLLLYFAETKPPQPAAQGTPAEGTPAQGTPA
jgi:signal peptidase II